MQSFQLELVCSSWLGGVSSCWALGDCSVVGRSDIELSRCTIYLYKIVCFTWSVWLYIYNMLVLYLVLKLAIGDGEICM